MGLKRIAYHFFCCLHMALPPVAMSQGVSITGRIVDAETLDALPYANVFIDQTTIGAASDVNGEYIIERVPDGEYKMVFSYVGYELFYKWVTVVGRDVRVSARLIPQKEMLQAVEVKGSKDKEWEGQLKQFNRIFFGESPLAKECKILNPWVLDFTYDKSTKIFKATASETMQIENKALGYSIDCTLQGFEFDKKGYKIRGLYKFEEINTLDQKEALKWTRNRKQAHMGSMRFLFKSIIDEHEEENGFKLYRDMRPNLNGLNVISFASELGKNVFDLKIKDNVVPMGPGNYKISIDGRLEIHHTTLFANNKTYRDVAFPVSWIECDKGYIMVTKAGHVINNDHIITSGELNTNRIAAMLPLDYSPGNMVVINYITKRKIAKRLQERVHVQTDKGFYYPGERMWFKAYMNFANQSVRDSLSRVLYVDLIDASKKIVQTKMLRLDTTQTAYGDFSLSSDWLPGMYYIRAYTSWMRNYGPDVFFHAPFALMDRKQKVFSTLAEDPSGDFIFTSDRTTYNHHEKIEMEILLDSTNEDYFANGSISVVPSELAIFPGAPEIKQTLFFPEDMPSSTLLELIYPVEHGLAIRGRLTRPKKRFTSGEMSVIQGKMDSLYNFSTDSKGLFTIDNLRFYDTTRFSFQARDKRGRIFGKTELLPRDVPPVEIPTFLLRDRQLDTVALSSPIKFLKRDIDTTKTVSDVPSTPQPEHSSAGGFDFVITGEQLLSMAGNQNIVQALQGRVPGFQVNASTGKASFRTGGGQESEPLFIVDGIPMYSPPSENKQVEQTPTQNVSSETASQVDISSANPPNTTTTSAPAQQQYNQEPSFSAANMLGHITVESVSRVEVNSRMDPRYGSMGANGVIAIFTKKAYGKNKDVKTFDSFVVEGFARPSSFVSPDSVSTNFSGDFTPTIYWNPSLSLSARKPTKISFQMPSKPGNYTARVEAISAEGKPLNGVFVFSVVR
jgi:CarboxypepD_reg-like domain/TonB-dependent Receptor Plug Domain